MLIIVLLLYKIFVQIKNTNWVVEDFWKIDEQNWRIRREENHEDSH